MTSGWAAVLLLALIYAVLMTVWNLMLMRLLEIAKGDVRRLSAETTSARQAISILGNSGQRIPTQRRSSR